MLAGESKEIFGYFGPRTADEDPHCEVCGRSTISRFGGDSNSECDSCAADFDRIIASSGGLIEIDKTRRPFRGDGPE